MARTSPLKLTLAPAFFSAQVDIAGPFYAIVRRTSIKVWALVLVCISTTATSITAMECYDTKSFVKALLRHSARYGYPKYLLPDHGSQLVKGCSDAKFSFFDLQKTLHTSQSFEVRISAVQNSEEHGLVERRIRTLREILDRLAPGKKASALDWETVFCEISNVINSLPLAMMRRLKSQDEVADFVTPNTLLLGRNNNREPAGTFQFSSNVGRIIEVNRDIIEDFYQILFSLWQFLIPRAKVSGRWRVSLDKLACGDIVMFQKTKTRARDGWQMGRIVEIVKDRYRQVIVRYCNSEDGVFRETQRSERSLLLIKALEESDLGTSEHQAIIAGDLLRGVVTRPFNKSS